MVFMEEKVNIKGPDSHQCSLVGGPGTIEGGAPLAWQVRGPCHPIRVKAKGVSQAVWRGTDQLNLFVDVVTHKRIKPLHAASGEHIPRSKDAAQIRRHSVPGSGTPNRGTRL
jgi:hypothetical protein